MTKIAQIKPKHHKIQHITTQNNTTHHKMTRDDIK